MSIQYDVLSGLDLSSLASATLAQVTQAINQIAPLSNVGGLLCFDGNATGGAGVGFPDVTSNPRFVRYLWLDTQARISPVLKRYVGSYSGSPANPSAMSNLYVNWTNVATASAGAGNLTEVIYLPYQTDITRVLNHATKYIEYSQTGGFPSIIQAKIQCISADLDYIVGDEINAESIQGQYAGVIIPGFTIHRYASGSDYKIRMAWPNNPLLDLLALRKDTTAVAALAQAKWAPVIYMYS